VQCDPLIFEILYSFSETSINSNVTVAREQLYRALDPFNFMQTLISSDYLVMKELKSECMHYFVMHLNHLLTSAFELKDESLEFPIDQLEDYLIDDIAGRI